MNEKKTRETVHYERIQISFLTKQQHLNMAVFLKDKRHLGDVNREKQRRVLPSVSDSKARGLFLSLPQTFPLTDDLTLIQPNLPLCLKGKIRP